MWKKTKDITEKEKQKYKAFFENEIGIFIIEKLTRAIIERCKLPAITENQMFALKIIISLLKLMKEIIKIMTQMMKKKREGMFKNHNFKICGVWSF